VEESSGRIVAVPAVQQFNNLAEGFFTLHVPVDTETGGIILLGARLTADVRRGTLDVEVAVEIDHRTVTISRSPDEGLLQVQRMREDLEPNQTPLVFLEAINQLVLHRAADEPWQLLDGTTTVLDPDGFDLFLKIVAQFTDRAAKTF
jgi:hypothetical protein